MDQTQNTKFQKVLEILKEQGMSDDQIAEFATNLTKTNFTRVYTEAMSVFTEEDLAAIEAAPDQDAANKLIADTYKERTGKEVADEMQKFLDTFSDGFLAEHAKGSSTQAGPTTENPASGNTTP